MNCYNHAVACGDELTGIRQTAKVLRVPERLFTYLICDLGYTYRSNKVIVPSAFMINSGYTVLKECHINGQERLYTMFTINGRAYLYKQFKERFALK